MLHSGECAPAFDPAPISQRAGRRLKHVLGCPGTDPFLPPWSRPSFCPHLGGGFLGLQARELALICSWGAGRLRGRFQPDPKDFASDHISAPVAGASDLPRHEGAGGADCMSVRPERRAQGERGEPSCVQTQPLNTGSHLVPRATAALDRPTPRGLRDFMKSGWRGGKRICHSVRAVRYEALMPLPHKKGEARLNRRYGRLSRERSR